MDKNMFRQQLNAATKQVIEFTRQVCINELVSNYKYILVPNVRAYDEHLNSNQGLFRSTLRGSLP